MGRPIFEARHFRAIASEIKSLGNKLQGSGRRFSAEDTWEAWQVMALLGEFFSGLFSRHNQNFRPEFFLESADILPEVEQYRAEETAQDAGADVGNRLASDLLQLADRDALEFRRRHAWALYETGEISKVDRENLEDLPETVPQDAPARQDYGGPVSENEFVSVVLALEENRRDMAPFDLLASEMNRAPHTEEIWETYTETVAETARAKFRAFCDMQAGTLNQEREGN